MLRNLNLTRNAKRICGTPKVGVTGSTVPSGALAFADVQSGNLGAREVRFWVESTTLPAGMLFVQEDTSWSAPGAPAGSYTVSGRLFVDDVDSGARSYGVTIGAATTKPVLRNLNQVRNGKRICGTPRVGVPTAAVPTAGPPYALLYNDIQAYGLAGSHLRVWIESSTFPAGALVVNEDSSWIFSGSPIADGSYTAQGRLFIDDADQGTAAFTVTVGG